MEQASPFALASPKDLCELNTHLFRNRRVSWTFRPCLEAVRCLME